MRCYRRRLKISYKDHVTNKEVRNRIQNATGVHDDLLTMVKKRKLRWYGYISRSSGMAKTTLQGTVKGARRRGRQKKRWEDNIKEWMGMGFGDSLRAAEDREGGKGIVATSSVVPRLPPRLRNWDEMREMMLYYALMQHHIWIHKQIEIGCHKRTRIRMPYPHRYIWSPSFRMQGMTNDICYRVPHFVVPASTLQHMGAFLSICLFICWFVQCLCQHIA